MPCANWNFSSPQKVLNSYVKFSNTCLNKDAKIVKDSVRVELAPDVDDGVAALDARDQAALLERGAQVPLALGLVAAHPRLEILGLGEEGRQPHQASPAKALLLAEQERVGVRQGEDPGEAG